MFTSDAKQCTALTRPANRACSDDHGRKFNLCLSHGTESQLRGIDHTLEAKSQSMSNDVNARRLTNRITPNCWRTSWLDSMFISTPDPAMLPYAICHRDA